MPRRSHATVRRGQNSHHTGTGEGPAGNYDQKCKDRCAVGGHSRGKRRETLCEWTALVTIFLAFSMPEHTAVLLVQGFDFYFIFEMIFLKMYKVVDDVGSRIFSEKRAVRRFAVPHRPLCISSPSRDSTCTPYIISDDCSKRHWGRVEHEITAATSTAVNDTSAKKSPRPFFE